MTFPTLSHALPSVTADEMAEVDRIMVDELGVDLLQMMENAGRNLAHLVRERFMSGDAVGSSVTVLAGRGGNGGGAMAAARRLQLWGSEVSIVCVGGSTELDPAPARQLRIAREVGVAIQSDEVALDPEDIVIDGLIGYSLRDTPRGRAAELIEWANSRCAPTVSLDVPSGFDSSSGVARMPIILASATLTLAMPKSGLFDPRHGEIVGEVYLGDIGVPDELFERIGAGAVPTATFSRGDVVRLL